MTRRRAATLPSQPTAVRSDLREGWLAASGVADVLAGHIHEVGEHEPATHQRRREPHECLEECGPGALALDPPWLCEHDARWRRPPDHVHNVDGPLARRLLEALPAAALDPDLSRASPALGPVLEAIATHPQLTGHGTIELEPGPFEDLRITLVTVVDDGLLAVEPDVVPGALPRWIDELDPREYAAYLRDRQYCLDHGTTRIAWYVAAQRYGIRDEGRDPIVDPFPVGTRDGVALAWW